MKMCAALARQGITVSLVADHGTVTADPFESYAVPRSFVLKRNPVGLFLPYWLRHVARSMYAMIVVFSVRLRRQDVLIYARDILSLQLARLSRLPFVLELHDLPHLSAGQSRRNRLRANLLERAVGDPQLVGLVCITEALRQALLERVDRRIASRVFVLADAADQPADCDGVDASTPRSVGYVGSFGPGRGLAIVEGLARSMPDTSFHLIGGRAGERDVWKQRFGVLPNVVIYGFVQQGELPCIYRKFDIALAPYQRSVPGHRGDDTSEWMSPLKVFEYMAHGKAIIVSDLPVLREVLDDEFAVLVSPENQDSWHDAVRRLLDDPTQRAKLASAARERFREHHTWDSRAKRIIELLSHPVVSEESP